jgi:two-component SAPR family response regulator
MNTSVNQSSHNLRVLPERTVLRESLLHLISKGIRKKLILFTAPMGFGKSVTAWLYFQRHASAKAFRAAWLTLESLDTDSAQFLKHIGEAVGACYPDVEAQWKELIAGEKNAGEKGKALPVKRVQQLGSELGGLLSKTVQSEFYVVLDNFQCINWAGFTKPFLQALLDSTPAYVHLVVLSRCEPDLNLSQHFAKDNAFRISQRELAFSESETAEFMEVLGGSAALSTKDLYALTEGWAAGTTLATRASSVSAARNDLRLYFFEQLGIDLAYTDIVNKPVRNPVQKFLRAVSPLESFPLKFGFKLFSILAPVTKPIMRHALEVLKAFYLFAEVTPDTYQPHTIFRRLAYADLDSDERKALSFDCAEFFRETDYERAVQFYLDAGAYPAALGLMNWAVEESAIPYDRILQHLDAMNDVVMPPRFWDMHYIIKAKALWLKGDVKRSEETLRQFELQIHQLTTQKIKDEAHLIHLENLRHLARYDDLLTSAEALSKSRVKPIALRAEMLKGYALAQTTQDNEAVKALLESAIRKARRLQHPRLLVTALRELWLISQPVKSLEWKASLKERDAFLSQVSPKEQMEFLRDGAFMHYLLGDFADALMLIAQCEPLAAERQADRILTTLKFLRAECLASKGDFKQAEMLYSDVQKRSRPIAELLCAALYADAVCCMYTSNTSRLAGIAEQLEAVLGELPRIDKPIPFYVAPIRAFHLAASGEWAAAQAALRTVMEREDASPGLAELQLFECWLAGRAFEMHRMAPEKFIEHLAALFATVFSLSSDQQSIPFKRYWRIAKDMTEVYDEAVKSSGASLPFQSEITMLHEIVLSQQRKLGLITLHHSAAESDKKKKPEPIRIRALGTLSIVRNGQVVEGNFSSRRSTREIFCQFLMKLGKAIEYDYFYDTSLMGMPKPNQVEALRAGVSAIRKALREADVAGEEERIVERSSSSYTLNLGRSGVDYIYDVEEFSSAIQSARQALTENNPPEAERCYKKAIDLYGGDFLEDQDVRNDMNFEEMRVLLQDQYLEALRYMADSYFAASRYSDAVFYAEKILDKDEVAVPAYNVVIKSYQSLNLHREAIDVFERCRAAFHKELRGYPPTALERLVRPVQPQR